MNYSTMNKFELTAICKERKIKSITGKNKDQIIEMIEMKDATPVSVSQVEVVSTSQSDGLSKRLTKMVEDGRRLNDDSSSSEKNMSEAMVEIKRYAKEQCESMGGTLIHNKSMTLYECQELFHKSGGPPPNEENKKYSIRPDGGILIMNLNGVNIPLLIIEDKVQGTNDLLHEQKKKRQATGNAIERASKNIRAADMIFANQNTFPYVMFVSGCDFHSSETIAKRIEAMNYGIPNHYIELSTTTTQVQIDVKMNTILSSININKRFGNKSIASVFVKAHKYNEMTHGSSLWRKSEIEIICKKIIDNVFESISSSLKPNT